MIFHALDAFSITFATAYVEAKNGLSQGSVLSALAMYSHYPRCENLPNNGQKQLK